MGVPAADKLCAELIALLPKIGAAIAKRPRSRQVFWTGFRPTPNRLVRIRPIGEVAGSDSKAILARVESKATKADVDGALSELSQLPPQQRAPADGWIAEGKGAAGRLGCRAGYFSKVAWRACTPIVQQSMSRNCRLVVAPDIACGVHDPDRRLSCVIALGAFAAALVYRSGRQCRNRLARAPRLDIGSGSGRCVLAAVGTPDFAGWITVVALNSPARVAQKAKARRRAQGASRDDAGSDRGRRRRCRIGGTIRRRSAQAGGERAADAAAECPVRATLRQIARRPKRYLRR